MIDTMKTLHPLYNKLLQDSVLQKIKQDIFYGLQDYTKSFPDFFYSWQPVKIYDYKRDRTAVCEAVREGLGYSNNMLIYIHIPFCFDKCTFCNIPVIESSKTLQELYISYVIREAEIFARLKIFEDKEILGIYFGGGTPTCIGARNLKRLLKSIRELFHFNRDCSITCESHPIHLIKDKGKRMIETIKLAGVDRISIGVQTFNQKVLSYCNRHHNKEEVEKALHNIKDSHLSNDIDMMIGLPGQTIEMVEKDLLKLEELKPTSIEYMRHDVVNKKVMRLYKRHPELLVDKDTLFAMNWLVQKWMQKHGYEQNGYLSENSRFSSFRYYWLKEVPYLALGPRTRSHFGEVCFYKIEKLPVYFSLIDEGVLPLYIFRILNKIEKAYRAFLLRSQTKPGIGIAELQERFGCRCFDAISPLIKKLKAYSLLTDEAGRISLSQSYGRYFIEDICCVIAKEAAEVLRLK